MLIPCPAGYFKPSFPQRRESRTFIYVGWSERSDKIAGGDFEPAARLARRAESKDGLRKPNKPSGFNDADMRAKPRDGGTV